MVAPLNKAFRVLILYYNELKGCSTILVGCDCTGSLGYESLLAISHVSFTSQCIRDTAFLGVSVDIHFSCQKKKKRKDSFVITLDQYCIDGKKNDEGIHN